MCVSTVISHGISKNEGLIKNQVEHNLRVINNVETFSF